MAAEGSNEQLSAPDKQSGLVGPVIREGFPPSTAGSLASSLTIGECLPMVAKFCPIFAFHPEEQYLPCSVRWFFERSHLVSVESTEPGAEPRLLLARAETTPERVAKVMRTVPPGADIRLVLDDKSHLAGQCIEELADAPVYATIKEVERGKSESLIEINYMVLYANNGAHGVAGKGRGAHEGDWKHVTARCTQSGHLMACYYGAHRSSDGTWVSGHKVPVEPRTGRIIAFVARASHGTYPRPRTYRRACGLANDVTSDQGQVWAPARCLAVTRPTATGVHTPTHMPSRAAHAQPLPIVHDRGGVAYDAVAPAHAGRRSELAWSNAPAGLANAPDAAAGTVGRGAVPVQRTSKGSMQAVAEFTPWLEWGLKWGSRNAPQLQDWFKQAEHPDGSTTLKRTCLPCIST